MGEIDNIFAEIKQKYQQKQHLSTNSDQSFSSSLPTKNQSNSGDKLNDLLGDFMDKFQQQKANHQSNNQSNNQDIFEEIKEKFISRNNEENNSNDDLFQDLIESKINTTQINNQSKNNQVDDILGDVQAKFIGQKSQKQSPKLDNSKLTEIQSQYQQKKAQTEVNKQSNIEAIKEEELNKQRRRKALTKKAEQWLNKLDPYSDEGFWFQQFAESYTSKLEAAIDYLDVLNENKF